MKVKALTFQELETSKGFAELVNEYIAETANMAGTRPQIISESYRALSDAGKFRSIGAYDGDTVVGFAGVLINESRHYAHPICSMEALYLRSPWRKGTNGLRLINKAKELAKEAGSPGLAFMAPPGSRYDKFCEATGMTHTHNAYWCKL